MGEYQQFLQCPIGVYLFNMHFRIDIISAWLYGTISNKRHMQGAALIRGMLLLEGDAYFDEDTQSCDAYFRLSAY